MPWKEWASREGIFYFRDSSCKPLAWDGGDAILPLLAISDVCRNRDVGACAEAARIGQADTLVIAISSPDGLPTGRCVCVSMNNTNSSRDWSVRLATSEDIPNLERLIALSVQQLQAGYYSERQRTAAIGSVFGVDRQLIADGTYFVVKDAGMVVGCGGWSRRRLICGVGHGPGSCAGGADLLDPSNDPAKIRAYFVHPDWARQGIARAILLASEKAIREAGFRSVELAATLAGEPFYLAFGYSARERYDIELDAELKLPVVRMMKEFVTRMTT